MPIDAGIFSNYLRAPKSIQEYDNEAMQAEGNALALRQQRMQMNALQRQQQQDEAFRSALGGDLSTEAGKISLYRVDPKRATEYFKGQADLAEGKAKADKERALSGKATQETIGEAMRNSRLGLEGVTTPEQYLAWHEANHKDPVLGPYLESRGVTADTARARITQALQTPGGFERLLNESKLGAERAYANLIQQKELELKAANELVLPNGQINTPLLNAKKQVAQAGASNVNISTGQKGLDNEFKLRGEFKGEPVYKAHQEMQSAYNQIKQALGQATPAGDLAGATKIMKLLDPGSVVRESELGMAMQATGLMDRLENYATNVVSGTKLTPKQRQEFQQLADALYGESVKQYNAKRDEYERLGGEYGLNSGRAIGPRASLAAKPQSPSNVVDFGSLK